MTATRIVLVDEARAQIRDILRWWAKERPLARDLFLFEFGAAMRRLVTLPASGAVDPRWGERGVRRVLLRRSNYFVFYRLRPDKGFLVVLVVLAVWHAARAGRPRLGG
jgi:plasmid stabilization system protein ParE